MDSRLFYFRVTHFPHQFYHLFYKSWYSPILTLFKEVLHLYGKQSFDLQCKSDDWFLYENRTLN